MSVLVAVISQDHGVVASDGRRFGSAVVNFASGELNRPAEVETDDFDKTFAVRGGQIVGAGCGVLEFSGRTVGQHIDEIVGAAASKESFLEIVERIAAGMLVRLNAIEESEISSQARILDLILVGRDYVSRGSAVNQVDAPRPRKCPRRELASGVLHGRKRRCRRSRPTFSGGPFCR